MSGGVGSPLEPPIYSSSLASPLSAGELVNQAWNYYREIGADWLTQASETIADLSSVHITPISFSVNYNVDSFLPAFDKPVAPNKPTLPVIAPKEVTVPELDEVTLRVLGDAPAEPDFSNITYLPPARPTQAPPTPPTGTDPVLEVIPIPTRPATSLPDVPTLRDLGVVEVAAITLPTFMGTRPTFDIVFPEDGALDWQETYYTSALKDELTQKIRDMLQGSLGLPTAIEKAIFDRGRAREQKLSRKLIQEVTEDMDSRGMSEPNGITGGKIKQAREANREAVGALNQTITIESVKLSIENVKAAMAQGMALESVLIQQNGEINGRALQAAVAVREYSINRVNALISYQNLQQTAYATDAQVWRDQLQGELSKLEKTRIELEVQRLVGQLNQDDISVYLAQLKGVETLADLYKTDVEAAKAKGEINLQRIAAAKLLVDKYDASVNAWGKLQDGYKTDVEAAQGTVKFAEVLGGLYATRMQGYKIKGDAYFQEGRFQLDRNGQTLDKFRASLAQADQDLRGQLAQLDGALRGFDGDVRLFEAKGNIAQAESASFDRTTSLKIENEKNRTSVALEQANINIQQALKIGEILVEQIKAKAAALAQLAAASQSGVNFGASLSASLGSSLNYSKGFSYSGDTDDQNPGF
jgi:ribosomal protein L18E